MMIFHAVAHVTILLILAFFVLFAAGKADGFAKLLGTLLGWWLVLVAVLMLVAHLTAPMFGGKPFGMDLKAMHGGWMHHDRMDSDDQTPAPAKVAPAPAKTGGH
jgi:hypothetical protein